MGRGVKRENEQNSLPSPKSSPTTKKTKRLPEDDDARFEGKPIPAEEARERWPERYRSKRNVKLIATSSESNGVKSDEKEILQARSHYTQAVVDGCLFNLFDDAYVKVRWRGYGPSEDTWEPIDGLSNCKESLKEFVTRGFKSRILPLPGDADFICGGPPCQGMSGFNRFRNISDPLKDPKNHQLVVFMDIIGFLKPKYVLMENVVDILKMAGGVLGCYAIGRLVSMDYQARVGILAAGSFGVPQCRMRVFLWGAHRREKLPQYPLPTHEFVGKGVVPVEFKEIVVGYEKGQSWKLEKSIVLSHGISDLPPVTNYESQDEMLYCRAPSTDFQKHIRLKRPGYPSSGARQSVDSPRKCTVTRVPRLVQALGTCQRKVHTSRECCCISSFYGIGTFVGKGKPRKSLK